MNTILLKGVSKEFSRQTIFGNISLEAQQGDTIAITGYNGSGKSTLLQIIAGYVAPAGGRVEYFFNHKKIQSEYVYQHISLAAPYSELVEEFTLSELLSFYVKFKTLVDAHSVAKILETSHLGFSKNKQIKYYSSGMKQRVKLALALMTDVPLILLDEPHSNLDRNGMEWFRKLMLENKGNKIIFISSNRIEEETGFCNKFINLEDYKNF